MLAAWVLRVQFLEEWIVQFLEECRVPSTSSERLLEQDGGVDRQWKRRGSCGNVWEIFLESSHAR